MPKRRNSFSGGEITVDEVVLRWTVRSAPQRATRTGLRLSVQKDGSHRELVLEYKFIEQPAGSRIRELPPIDLEMMAADISLAMDAGWNPHSRGRPFEFQMFEDE